LTQSELKILLDDLRKLPDETEWLEFKVNRYLHEEIGEYISALSNAACLHGQQYGYLIFGIENNTHNVIGTRFKPRKTKEGNEELENWLSRLLSPRIDFIIYEFDYDKKPVVLFKIDASHNIPVKFKGIAYIRVGTYKKKLADYPEKERKIWAKKRDADWSAHICEEATINDLDMEAISIAMAAFKERNKNRPFASEIDTWDTVTFLERAKIIRQGKITNTAIILLGRPESAHFLSPSYAQITWKLEDKEKAYEHFAPPFYLNVNKIYQKIRNTVYKILPQDMLLPIEINKYEQWVILEALNNCIAHQDYTLCSRIIITERPNELVFTNAGDFFEGTVDDYTLGSRTPQKYRNSFLSHAMFNLGMIDTMGYGIHKMFQKQRERYFPLPEYDLSDPQKVLLKIYGHIIDEKYTRLLMDRTDLDLKTVILLDKVQKRHKITKNALSHLRKNRLIEGRYPNVYIAAHIAAITGDKSGYIKNRPFDNKHYKTLILDFIRQFGSASRKDIDSLLMNKLPDVLNEKQKKNKINNLLAELARKDKAIRNIGSDRNSSWVLT